MPDEIALDVSEVRALAADLTRAGDQINGKVLPIIKRGALNIKTQMQREMSASKHFKGVAPSIDFDIHGGDMFGVGIIEAEIGPNKERANGGRGSRIVGISFNESDFKSGSGSAAPLANIAYFGGSRGGGTVPDPQGALDAETPGFERALGDILGGIL